MTPLIQIPAARRCVDISDRCVMCGLCLPHCPTYTLKSNEAESPRGRISLIKAFTSSALVADEMLVGHLENCLQCRRCEAACPANVPFGNLMDSAKALLYKRRNAALTKIPRWLDWLVSSRALRQWVSLKLRLYHASGLQWLLRKIRVLEALGLDNLDSLLVAASVSSASIKKSTIRSNRQVVLFTGCVAEIFDRETLIAAKRLLEATGVAVKISSRQSCCGALHQHAGDNDTAQRFIRKNAAAFSDTPPQTLISCASGCGAQLQEHESTLGIHHFDIHEYLYTHSTTLRFMPLEETVALHTPCTMSTCLNGSSAVSSMLNRIPTLQIEPLPDIGCCGAAGAYMLTQPDTASALLEQALKPLVQTGVKTLVSSNLGCMLHFRQGLARHRMGVEVIHPATLLARQLANTPT